MKVSLIYIISFLLIFNPTILLAKSTSIKDKLGFYEIIDCEHLLKDFTDFSDCVENHTLTSQKLGLLKNKTKREIYDVIAIINIINESVIEGLVNNQNATKNFENFIDSNYKKKSNKQKLKDILDDSKCKNLNEYNKFIYCFNEEFRNFEIYQNSDIRTKERIEHIVFNSLILTKPDGFVYTLKKENLYGVENLDKLYEEGDGFEFFFTLMNALGTDYFKKIKSKSDVDWERVIKFIVIAIIMAVVAKKLMKSFNKKTYSSNSTSSTSSAASSSSGSVATPYGGLSPMQRLSTASVAKQPLYMRNMFKFAPSSSVMHKRWFKLGFMGGF